MKKKILPFIVCSILLCSCGSSGESYSVSSDMYDMNGLSYAEADYYDDASYSYTTSAADVDKGDMYPEAAPTSELLTYSAFITLNATEYETVLDDITSSIHFYDAYKEYEYSSGDVEMSDRSMNLHVRVPTEYYEKFLEDISKNAQVVSKEVSVDNITVAYSDSSIAREALLIQEQRLLDMMAAATTIDEMIRVEDRLTEVQANLKRTERNLAGMDKDLAYADIQVNVREVKDYVIVEETLWDVLKAACEGSKEHMYELFEGTLVFIIYAFPYAIVLCVVSFIVHITAKKRNKKIQDKITAGKVKE